MAVRGDKRKIARGDPGKVGGPTLVRTNHHLSPTGASQSSLSKHRARFVKLANGERRPLLIESSGIPHFYATLFITTQARNAAKAPNTQLAILLAIRYLMSWAESNRINLEERFVNQQFLTETELESLRTFTQSHMGSIASEDSEVIVISRLDEGARVRLHKALSCVSSSTHYIRITYIAKYIDWFAVHLLEHSGRVLHDSILEQIRTMTGKLLLKRPRQRSPSLLSARQGLPDEGKAHLLDVIQPQSAFNPFIQLVQKRNEVIILILYYTGIRAGELLAIKVSDFNFQSNELVIPRRHGDVNDPRNDQPVAKTMDRRLVLSQKAMDVIFSYAMTERRTFPAARRHEFLVVVHQSGRFQGQPLSMKGLAKIFAKLQRTDPKGFNCLTAHVLRHTANDNLSDLMDEQKVPEAKEQKTRSYMMGWKEGSRSAAIYTRRHTEKKAREASLKLQEGWRKGKTIGKQ